MGSKPLSSLRSDLFGQNVYLSNKSFNLVLFCSDKSVEDFSGKF